MSLESILLTICLAAHLDCSNVTSIEWAPTTHRDIQGQIFEYTDGTRKIILNKSKKGKWSDYKIKQVVSHELAHHLEFDRQNYTHDVKWENSCKKIMKAAKVRGIGLCGSHGTQYH